MLDTCKVMKNKGGKGVLQTLAHFSMRYAHPEDSLKDAVEKLVVHKYKN